jgi:hypothetical protein
MPLTGHGGPRHAALRRCAGRDFQAPEKWRSIIHAAERNAADYKVWLGGLRYGKGAFTRKRSHRSLLASPIASAMPRRPRLGLSA